MNPSAGSDDPLDHDQRRLRGRYYTPHTLARTMIQQAVSRQSKRRIADLKILDPACGDGAFIVAAFEYLMHKASAPSANSSSNAMAVIQRSLFGVDLDSHALVQLRSRLAERADVSVADRPALDQILQTNFRCGNALTGPDLNCPASATNSAAGAISWNQDFPQIATAGGFDLVVGNPPYHRELHAKSLFDQVAQTELGSRWRQARMDYWFYFLHRGLDLLKPGGRLTFVVNSYWVGSRGARKMIHRLQNETTIESMTLLGKTRIFPDVSGQHMVLQLQRKQGRRKCRILDLTSATGSGKTRQVAQSSLFLHGRLLTSGVFPQLSGLPQTTQLAQHFDVRQGMAENPPVVSRRHLSRLSEPARAGDGVFVLRPQEISDLDLEATEAACLQPYYYPRHIGRYHLPPHDGTCVLYLDGKNPPDLSQCQRIQRHLSRFRPIMEARRETRLGRTPWWQLHWPRRADLFVRPRVLCRQMGRRPSFVYADRPTFVGFSVHIVIPQSQQTELSLPALTGLLNSRLAQEWFEILAKQRGVHLEISGELLRQFPLPPSDAEHDAALTALVHERQQLSLDSADLSTRIERLEQQIEDQVRNWYGL